MSSDEPDEIAARAARARARAHWPGRLTDLAGSDQDPSYRSPSAALAAMDELCEAAWGLAGREPQPPDRNEWPGLVWREGRVPPEHEGGS
ncbi:MAG: hypothetical protein IT457_15715 [Planctomycetes bacterium]|nr:hypothetical protein [Planctomycetota bacterium]